MVEIRLEWEILNERVFVDVNFDIHGKNVVRERMANSKFFDGV
jgi:hypothetical protein